MSDFNKDDYLNDLPDADELANGQASPDADGADAPSDTGEQLKDDMLKDAAAEQSAGEQASEESAKQLPKPPQTPPPMATLRFLAHTAWPGQEGSRRIPRGASA